MATMLSSVVALDHAFPDGRRNVTETHTDSMGGVTVVTYLAEAGTDYQSVANARSQSILNALAQQEIEGLLNG